MSIIGSDGHDRPTEQPRLVRGVRASALLLPGPGAIASRGPRHAGSTSAVGPDRPRGGRSGLATWVAGVPLANPIGLASGFDKACERVGPLGKLGFGYVVGGTVTREPRPGNAKPRIARTPEAGACKRDGSAEPWGGRGRGNPADSARHLSLGVLADEAVEDVSVAADLLSPHVDAFELNASSPNAGWVHRADHVGKVIDSRSRAARRCRLRESAARSPATRSVRGPSDARVANQAGAAGITCANTIPVQDGRIRPDAGVCPAATDHRTPEIVAAVRSATRGACRSTPVGESSRPRTPGLLRRGRHDSAGIHGLIYEGPAVVGGSPRGCCSR